MNSAAGTAGALREMRVVGYLLTVWRGRWVVLSVCGVGLAIALVITLTTPKVYESTATVITPKEGGGVGLLGLGAAGLLQQIPGFSLPSLTPNRDLFVGLLKSRTMAEAVVERFRLQERYRARYREDAVKRFQKLSTIALSREGVISVRVEDTDPVVAAEMANFYLERLDRLAAQYSTGEAGKQRLFLVEQLAHAKVDLDTGEQALRSFQERNRAIVLQEQTRGAIDAAARLKGEIMAAEVQLQVMRNFATESNPEVIMLKRRIDELSRQLAQMQYGDGTSRLEASSRERRDFSVPFVRVPEVGLELARLTRNVKVQETLVTLLSQQMEQARIAEAKDLPVVQVLDRAVPAERHVRPRVSLNLMIAGAISLFAGVILSLSFENLGGWRQRSTEIRSGS